MTEELFERALQVKNSIAELKAQAEQIHDEIENSKHVCSLECGVLSLIVPNGDAIKIFEKKLAEIDEALDELNKEFETL